MSNQIFKTKIKRLKEGNKPRVLDLFAGCGGISLGFNKEGFEIVATLEIDEYAVLSHAKNFHNNNANSTIKFHAKPRDITQIEPETLFKQLGIEDESNTVIDIIVGGPPCQAFARVGRAKLREVAEHPEAFLQDPRSNLYLHYINYVEKLMPIALLMENVPDVLNFGGHNISDEMCEVLTELGYTCGYTLLNSVFYGVPQMRERMFLIAYKKELGVSVKFPEPSHDFELPRGYHGSRNVALKTIQENHSYKNKFYIKPSKPDPNKTMPAVSAEQAIGDLPPITLHLEGKLKRGARRFTELIRYTNGKVLTEYQKTMRNWPGFESNDGVYDHVIRYLPRDYPIFNRMEPGNQYPEAYKHALNLLSEKIANIESETGTKIEINSPEYEKLKKEIVPPYDSKKFPNKWRKMERDMPARTLMAHLGKDGYSHIHYDSNQQRTISVREAARLQSFPDGFKFSGTMNPAFRQIGNAVPPLLASALAREMMETIKGGIK